MWNFYEGNHEQTKSVYPLLHGDLCINKLGWSTKQVKCRSCFYVRFGNRSRKLQMIHARWDLSIDWKVNGLSKKKNRKKKRFVDYIGNGSKSYKNKEKLS